EVIEGTGLLPGALMVNGEFPEVPPPGVGVNTVTCAVPDTDMSAALIDACSCAEFTNVVVRLAPLQFTTDRWTNPLPVTVRVKAAPPAVADDGDSELNDGVGLFATLIVNAEFPEVPPPGAGVNTVTCAVPAEVMSAALIDACSCPEFTNVVVRLAPLHFT